METDWKTSQKLYWLEKAMKEKNEIGEEFEQILKKYTDPLEIKKRLNAKKREQILEDKKSSFVLE